MRQSGSYPRGATKTKYFPLNGGLMLETPPLKAPPGALIDALNFECLPNGGYRRMDGFEVYDGQDAPSDASYWVLNFDAGTGAGISEGDTVDGATSGAQGVALIDAVVTSGTWGVDAAGYIVLTAVTGTFQDNENLEVSAAVMCLADGLAVENGAATAANDALWSADAIETQRANIGAIPGSGAVRGVWVYNGAVYGFRDNAGATACVMHKATAAGWVAQDLGYRVSFTLGTAEMVEGGTLTQGANTATILRVAVQSGTWAGGDAAGYIIIDAAGSPGAFASGIATDGASGSCTLSGAETAQTLPAGGRYEFVNHNFYANADAYRMYGVNGVGPAFEWDGTAFVPIATGNTVDTPAHIAAHKFHLFLTFANGSLQHSGTGTPYEWYAGAGAAELGAGDELVGIYPQTGGTLGVFTENQTKILYGSDSSDWDLKSLSEESGAKEWTIQRIGKARYLNDHGITSLENIQEFGDFDAAVFSQEVERVLDARRGTEVASIAARNKNQYRLFFSDGYGVIVSFKGSALAGFTVFDYGLTVACTGWGKDSSGNELMFFGDDSGYVYQIDAGDSYNGVALDALLKLTYYHLGSPSRNKRFRKVELEVEAPAEATISYQTSFNYGSSAVPVGLNVEETVEGSGSYWDSVNWDQFNWASDQVSVIEGPIDGSGRNISLSLYSSSLYTPAYTVYGVIYHYSMRRLVR